MIHLQTSIILYNKKDIELLEMLLKEWKIDAPIIVIEYETKFKINFTSEYEYWDLDDQITDSLSDYEFTSNLGSGGKKIRMEVSRVQLPFSTDNWGRPLENLINDTKYLIRKHQKVSDNRNSLIRVWFGKENKNYFTNIIEVVTSKNQEGFAILNDFNQNKPKIEEFYKNQFFKEEEDAFWTALNKIERIADEDYKKWKELNKPKRGNRKKK